MRFWLLIMLIFSYVNESFAGMENLMNFAAQDGSLSNHTAPAIIKDQQGGYLSGGSLIIRGPRPKELSPITIQTPKLKYDACTGSGDFRFGAMSYISGEEFSRFLKNVARASGAYLVKMSIKTACPQCEDIMTYLETVARDINNLTINQCSMAQLLASGAFSKLVSNDKQQCMMNANLSGSNNDMFETTRKCQENAGSARVNDSEQMGDALRNEYNLVWKALGESSSGDSDFKELMMSISGTVIAKKEYGAYKFKYLPSLVLDKDLLEKYIGNSSTAGKILQYSCDSKIYCLNPTLHEVTLEPNKTIYGNVSRILRSLAEKVRNDKVDFSDEEKALLAFSTIPILNLIEMEIASKTADADIIVRVGEFVDAVCIDLMTNFMENIIYKIIAGLKNLEYAQNDDFIIQNFTKDCEFVRRNLRDARFASLQKLQLILQVKERMKNQIQEFELGFARFLNDVKS